MLRRFSTLIPRFILQAGAISKPASQARRKQAPGVARGPARARSILQPEADQGSFPFPQESAAVLGLHQMPHLLPENRQKGCWGPEHFPRCAAALPK